MMAAMRPTRELDKFYIDAARDLYNARAAIPKPAARRAGEPAKASVVITHVR